MSTARTRPEFNVDRADLSRLFDKLPPHAIEAEMSLLGSMILAGVGNIHIVGEVMHVIKGGGDFFLPKHGVLYETLVELFDRHSSIDIVQLAQRLKDKGQYEAIGKEDYLVELAESVPTAVNAPHYARIVRDKSKLRHLLDAAGHILREAHESSESPNLIIDKAEQRIFEIAQSSEVQEPSALSALIQQAFEQLQARAESGQTLTGVATGFNPLDEMLNGMQRGEMLVLAARPSMGKTALALNIAEQVAVDRKQPVAVFSLEMGKQQLAERLLSSNSGVDGQKIRRNQLSEEELRRLQETAAELSAAPMFIDDTPGLSILELRAKARRLVSQHDIKMIMIDYLQLLSSPGSESRTQEVSLISRSVKGLARELNLPVLVLSQLNRNPEGRESKRPMLSDLRESGSIEQDADVVMMLHREDYYHHDDEWKTENADKLGVSELIIAKQRNGPTGTVNLQFNKETVRFHTAAPTYMRDQAAY
jgi:replicative DNA helicase